MTKNKNRVTARLVMLFLALSTPSILAAQTKVVVIPLAGEDLKPLKNVISVSPSNGDFTSPVAALNSISNASATNPYLIVLGPGVYDLGSQQLVMKEYVELAGSGSNATFIRGTVSGIGLASDAALVIGANNASIRDLTIENQASSGVAAFSIWYDSVVSSLANVEIKVDSPAVQAGIIMTGSSINIVNSKISILGTTGTPQYGIFAQNGSNLTFNSGFVDMTAGLNEKYGVFLAGDTSNVLVTDSQLDSSGGTNSYGLFAIADTDTVRISNSRVTGLTNSIRGNSTTRSYISNSILNGSVAGNPNCSFTFLVDGTALDQNCDVTP